MDEYPKPIVTVDNVPLTIHEDRLKVLLARRTADPFAGRLALIGGYIHIPEDATAGAAARRVLREKAGITQLYIEQLSTFSGPHRDERGWTLSVVYFSLTPFDRIEAALLQEHLVLVPVEDATGLPFDHDDIVRAAVDRVRGKGAYSDLPARLLGDDFTLQELHRVYEIAIGDRINKDNFRQKTLERGFVEPTGGKRFSPGSTKPGQLYRLKPGTTVFDRRI